MATRIAAFLMFAASSLFAADPGPWPQFRGPNGSGVNDSAKPPVEFGPDKNVAWKVAVPPGMSSPIICGDKIVLTAFENGKLFTIAYARQNGTEAWRIEAPAKQLEIFHPTENSPATPTPATDGERIVSYFGSCGLFCYSADGKFLWRYELPTAVTDNEFGTGTSPIIANGKVLLYRDLAKDSMLLAVDLKTGSQAWQAKREGMPTSYSTPVVWNNQVVVSGHTQIQGYDLDSGKEVWKFAGVAAVNCATPVVADDLLLYAGWAPSADEKMPSFDDMLTQFDKNKAGYLTKESVKGTFFEKFFDNNDKNKDGKLTSDEWEENVKFMLKGKNAALAIKAGGVGDISQTHQLWRKVKGLPYVPSALAYRGQYIMVNDRGMVSAYDVKTGEEKYLQERLVSAGGYYSSPVAADGRIYFTSLDGTVSVVTAEAKPQGLARNKLGERATATPALAGNTVYVRTDKHLWAFAESR